MSAGFSRLAVRLLCAAAFLGGGAVGFGAGILLILLTAFGGSSGVDRRPFDHAGWNDPDWKESITAESHLHSIRQEMVDDLLAHHLHEGMTQEEVLELIGPKDPNPYFKDPGWQAWSYRLGMERGLGVDNEWLLLNFSDDGRLIRARLAND